MKHNALLIINRLHKDTLFSLLHVGESESQIQIMNCLNSLFIVYVMEHNI